MYMDGIQLKLLNREKDINFGSIYENAAAQELKAHGYDLYYYNSKKQGELDFIIEKDGSITDIKVVRPVEEHFDKEFVAVFKNLPKWKPGKDKGNVVRTKMRWYMHYDFK